MIALDNDSQRSDGLSVPGATVVNTPNHPLIARVHALPISMPGADRAKITFDYLSPSQVKTYVRCNAAYLFKYFYKMTEPDNSAMFFGSAVHAGAEAYMGTKRAMLTSGMSSTHEGLKALAIEQSALYVQTKIKDDMIWKTQWKKGPAETFESMLEGVQVATASLADEVWKDTDVIEVERGYVIEWSDGKTLPFLGYADVIERTPNGQAVRDLKTGIEKSKMDAALDIALSAYAQSYELFSGIPTRAVGYNSYVRNKTPKIVTVDAVRDDGDLNRLYSIARAVTKSLAQGIYIPVDDTMKCSSCAFFKRCRSEFA